MRLKSASEIYENAYVLNIFVHSRNPPEEPEEFEEPGDTGRNP